LVEQLYQRFRHILHELGKFGVVGLFAYLVDSGIFAFMLAQDSEPLFAKTVSTVVSATVAFFGNRFWTWRHRARSSLTREYLLYFGFNAAGLGIALATLGLSHYGLGAVFPMFRDPVADFIAAQLIGNAFATVFRFWAYRRFVFIAPAPAPAEAAGR
jgi:putative flippase GtrA